IMSASVQGRVALGQHAGTRVGRLGGEPPELAGGARGPRQAHLDGFDRHANVRVPPHDRARLEHLCRYLLRPPLVQDRVRLRADGRVVVKLKAAWRDGTTHLVFEPLEFLAKLAALTPRPRRMAASLFPPIHTGIGCWTGFGSTVTPSRRQNSPANVTSSSLQHRRMIRSASSVRRPRSRKGTPAASNSRACSTPTPKAGSMRPLERTSPSRPPWPATREPSARI
ncbi:MAG TPA: transposase, partial [Methylomirabilota bacterium]|nr:transposase [Methylomirabilota bacterium]